MTDWFSWDDSYDTQTYAPESDIAMLSGLHQTTDPTQSFDQFMADLLGLPLGGTGFDQLWMPGVMSGIQNTTDPMVLDNETGQTISLSEALRLTDGDWSMFDQSIQQNYQQLYPQYAAGTATTNAGDIDPNEAFVENGTAADSQQPLSATTATAGGLGGLSVPQWVAGLAGVGTLGVGLAGVIQKAMQGDTEARTTLQREIEAASPEEKQAITQAVQGLQTTQNFALGSPAGLMARLGARAPAEEQAWQQGLQGTQQSASAMGQYLYGQGTTPGLLPSLAGGTRNLLGGQEAFFQAMQPMATQLAQGQLPITPQMRESVDLAFQPVMGDITRQAIESARQRGFAGGAELLNQAPAAALAGPALADLQGQKAAAVLNLAQQVPQLATQMAGAYSTPAALRMQGMSNLMNLNQNIVGQLGNYGQQGMTNQTDFLRAITAPLSAQGSIGTQMGNQRINSADTTQTNTQPYSLLDSFAPLASLMGGAGQFMYGLSGGQRNLSGMG